MSWDIFFGPRRSGKSYFLYLQMGISVASSKFVLCGSNRSKSTWERNLQFSGLSNTHVLTFANIETQLSQLILQHQTNTPGSVGLFVDNGEFLTFDERCALSLICLLAPPNAIQIVEVQTANL
jgi:hypothetical protein